MKKLVNLDHLWDKVPKEQIHRTFAKQESKQTCACTFKMS